MLEDVTRISKGLRINGDVVLRSRTKDNLLKGVTIS